MYGHLGGHGELYHPCICPFHERELRGDRLDPRAFRHWRPVAGAACGADDRLLRLQADVCDRLCDRRSHHHPPVVCGGSLGSHIDDDLLRYGPLRSHDLAERVLFPVHERGRRQKRRVVQGLHDRWDPVHRPGHRGYPGRHPELYRLFHRDQPVSADADLHCHGTAKW